MTNVQTARGSAETATLGRVLMHEHVFVMTAEVQQSYPDEWGAARAAGQPSRHDD